jgi:predicted nucleic acid-binding protein
LVYWDTSCVLKLYVSESDSDVWTRLAVSGDEDFAASALIEAELACALQHKEARGEVVPGGAAKLLGAFRRDVRAGRFTLYPVGSDVIAQAVSLSRQCYEHVPAIPVRALDALHLATSLLLKCTRVATTDERMRRAAGVLGTELLG